MKKYILITVAIIAAFAANAQVNSLPLIRNRFTFGIDGGPDYPGNDFAPTPKTGFYYDAYAGLKFSKLIGVMVQYGVNDIPYSADAPRVTDAVSSNSGGYITSEYL